MRHFARGSSRVDWCETNYVQSSYIAEFYNCASNILFFVVPPILMCLFRPYTKCINGNMNVVLVLMMFVGLSSVYFHATLSLLGQLVDELSILWLMASAFGYWLPQRILKQMPVINGSRVIFQRVVFTVAGITTILSCIKPEINAFVLLSFGLPFVVIAAREVRRCKCQRVKQLCCSGVLWWCLAVICWISDRCFCDLWLALKFPYLHCAWHLLIAVSSYIGCVICAYIFAANETPELSPKLVYWPVDNQLGLPYVRINSGKRNHKA
ncbi:uncharacterized protein TRIADDRAFT_23096 [Trichoplax adhaerens]|uniref:Alkaline ceramidase n=1 Tax=Trichoplax adhaerens TaxID=10228 RepID=B3RSL2_TRIAD|nr:hypothetical protein TRIADDRAFT_23096 [Trichoplax adhaerens]EDV27078.1 hypothetical protein TRIADDRAFT_23096 [Trichoplax adhaerens]|eukprot:XP_002111074.1 hypothetical protein TRIADDRAFT_23096 [Trichoplax adhaerens]